ncbi:hypothetical protein CW745_01245 [Psychromonas sp. psych-6C06]|uniref:DUF4123 domain-containing protein n=1 Tax=Psychromonas sp. psych-6C06 TaxID=2058089 RepID=UPI000C34BB73|nr:DUF4123 domain-containing protein [Psychromonas sp. psych-6C06]PKF63505.1 hypothetical protein CW745_01245 [Psychromonas sp. psych-6C06]
MTQLTVQELTTEQTFFIQEKLWQCNESGLEPIVYAILGGARDKQIEKIIRLGSLKSACLIDGELSYEMAVAAPYMVRLEKNHVQTLEILKKGWGNSWGIFAITYSPATLIKVRQNCKKMAKVKLPDNKTAFFRYYDPRVMRPYLPTCTSEEAKQVFGPITEYVMEGEVLGELHRFKICDGEVKDLCQPISSQVTTVATDERQKLSGEELQHVEQLKKQLGDNFIRQAVGYLKLKPLAYTEPTDNTEIYNLIDYALVVCYYFDLNLTQPETLTDLALIVEHWGVELIENDWVQAILRNHHEYTEQERINEIFLEKVVRDVGLNSVNFPIYCIKRFTARFPEMEVDKAHIHVASELASEIAEHYQIIGLTNHYLCTEMVLFSGDFREEKQYQPMQQLLSDTSISEHQRVEQAINWLYEND